MSKLISAEEILKEKEEIAQIQGIDFSVVIFNDAIQAMNKYAKMIAEYYVQEALKAVVQKARIECPEPKINSRRLTTIYYSDDGEVFIDENSILKAFPLEKIKLPLYHQDF